MADTVGTITNRSYLHTDSLHTYSLYTMPPSRAAGTP